jgi:hypothetical protein
MTQAQLDSQIASITGESLTEIHLLGFSLESDHHDELESSTVQLVLDCPFCRCPVPYPGLASDDSETMAECDRCDVYFAFDLEEIYVLESDNHFADAIGTGDKARRHWPTEKSGLREN